MIDVEHDQSLNPYFLHSSDQPRLTLVSQVLTSENFVSWNRSMEMALNAKNKLGFVDGSITAPDPNASTIAHARWKRVNDFFCSWILNSVSKEIASSIIFADSAVFIWQDLHTRFHQQNGTIRLIHVRTQHQLADLMTKPLPEPQFSNLLSKMSIKDIFMFKKLEKFQEA